MFRELLGKANGDWRGKGGSMHIAVQDNGNPGANAMAGGSAGIATGAALSANRLAIGSVADCLIGDGALAPDLLYESRNMAVPWQLPVIYACENNLCGECTHVSEMAAGSLCARAQSFSIASHTVDGQDVLAVKPMARELLAKARNGEGPKWRADVKDCQELIHHQTPEFGFRIPSLTYRSIHLISGFPAMSPLPDYPTASEVAAKRFNFEAPCRRGPVPFG